MRIAVPGVTLLASLAKFSELKRKSRRQKQQPRPSADKAQAQAGMSGPAVRNGSRRRRWIFRLAACGLPLVLLLALELALRGVGYGYATDYFLRSEVEGRPVLIENADFTKRFFPPGLVRTPQPLVIPAQKPPGTTRIFVFGESAAMGDPEPAYSFSRIMEVLLRSRHPGRSFEVINVATTAINSHVLRAMAKACVPRQGDVWIIYMGNNEVVGPYGAGTVFSSQAPALALIRGSLALKSTRLGQGLEELKDRFLSGRGRPATWEGMEMFLDKQVRVADPALARVYRHFERNLDDMVALGVKSGARVLLSTVASNLRDSGPFASAHDGSLGQDALAQWNRLYQDGVARQEAGDFAAALQRFQEADAVDGQWAELAFRLGQCHGRLTNQAEALKQFERARDLDTLRFRADTRINEIIRASARRFKDDQVRLVDAVEAIASHSPGRVAGGEFFHEHVHLNFPGNYLLAKTLLEHLETWQPERMGSAKGSGVGEADWLSAEACAEALAWTPWNQMRVLEEMIKRLELPPFTHQANHLERMAALRTQAEAVQQSLKESGMGPSAGRYEKALARQPGDWVLRDHYATLLQESGDLNRAAAEWKSVMRLIPHYAPAYYHLGNSLDKLGRSDEALASFREALDLNPDMHEARNGLALALSALGRTNEAQRCLEEALRRKPDFVEARVNLAGLFFGQNKRAEAAAQYTDALRYNSNSVAAHLGFGRLLAQDQQWPAAERHYRAAVAAAPENGLARYQLANLLAALKNPEAIEHYQAAIRSNPDFGEARFNLGLELANLGRNAEAMAQFEEVVRLQPGLAEAHLNLGVAYAKQGRFAEAVAQFEETLRIEPAHAGAQKFLDQARARLP